MLWVGGQGFALYLDHKRLNGWIIGMVDIIIGLLLASTYKFGKKCAY